MIMDCVSSICRTVEAAMINKICHILNSMGPVSVIHQIQLNMRIIACLLSEKWQCHSAMFSFCLLWTPS